LGLYIFMRPSAQMGAIPHSPSPKHGEVRIDPRQSNPESPGNAKRRDQGVSQGAPESSSATSPSPSRKNP
jgi:hypothetical protein